MSMISPEAIAKYIQRRHDDLAACKEAISKRDFSVMENVGHKMKGNGLTFGFPELAEIGKKMETAAINKDAELVTNQLSALEDWCDSKKTLNVSTPPLPASI